VRVRQFLEAHGSAYLIMDYHGNFAMPSPSIATGLHSTHGGHHAVDLAQLLLDAAGLGLQARQRIARDIGRA